MGDAARADPFLAKAPPEVRFQGFQAEGYVLSGVVEPIAVLGQAHRGVFGAALESMCRVTQSIALFVADWCGLEAA